MRRMRTKFCNDSSMMLPTDRMRGRWALAIIICIACLKLSVFCHHLFVYAARLISKLCEGSVIVEPDRLSQTDQSNGYVREDTARCRANKI